MLRRAQQRQQQLLQQQQQQQQQQSPQHQQQQQPSPPPPQASSSGPPPQRGSGSAVDWAAVDRQLAAVPPDFTDPKFYALKHVVEILTAEDPRTHVAQLRAHEEALAQLVDAMVQGYHAGFARSIQNYSQILHLFGDAKEQVAGLKKALSDASGQLSAQSRSLQQQWRKSLSLEAQLKLLDGIRLVAGAPERIDDALAAKDWPAAVLQLLEACNKLVKDDVGKAGALRKLKSDMLAISLMVEAQLLQELLGRVFAPAWLHAEVQAAGPHARQQQQRALLPAAAQQGAGGRGGAATKQDLARMSPVPGSSSGSSMPTYVLDALSHDAGSGGQHQQQQQHRHHHPSPASPRQQQQQQPGSPTTREHQQGQQQQQQPGSVGELVSCLLLLDALDDASLYLLLHARAGLRQMIMRIVEGWAAQQEQLAAAAAPAGRQRPGRYGGSSAVAALAFGGGSAGGLDSGSSSRVMGGMLGYAGGSAVREAWTVPPPTQLAVQQLLAAVFDACLKALANLGLLLQQVLEAQQALGGSISSSKGGGSGGGAPTAAQRAAGGQGGGSSGGAGGRPSAAALQRLRQEARGGSGGGAAGGGGDSDAPHHPRHLHHAAAGAGDAISGALDPLVALQSMQGGLLPVSSVRFAATVAASLGASITAAAAPAGSSGLASASAVQGLEWSRLAGSSPAGLLKSQCAHLWQEMQAECLLLLAELLQANLRAGAGAGGGAAGGPAGRQGGWLSDFADLGERAKGQLLAAAAATSGGGASSGTASMQPAAAAGGGAAGAAALPGGGGGPAAAGPTGGGGSALRFRFELTASELAPSLSAPSAIAAAAAAAGISGEGAGPPGAAALATLAAAGGTPGSGVASAAAAAAAAGADAGPEGGSCYTSLLQRGLGQAACRPYLAPAVYLTVNSFVDNALVIISDTCQDRSQQQHQAPGGDAGGSSSSSDGLSAAEVQGLDARLRSVWLRASLADHVSDGFLPRVWVDMRSRCTAALEDADAFKAQLVGAAGLPAFMAQAAAGGHGSSAAGSRFAGSIGAAAAAPGSAPRIRPPASAVPAAGFAVQILLEVVAWLPAVPPAAASTLTGILQAVLNRVLEELAAHAAASLGTSKAGQLSARPALALIMATEPDAPLVAQDDASAFFVPPAAAAAVAAAAAGVGGAGAAASASADAAAAGEAGELPLRAWGQPVSFQEHLPDFQAALKAADKPLLVPGHHWPPVKVRGLGLEGEAAAEEVQLYCLRERPSSGQQLLAGSRLSGLTSLAALAESADWVADSLAHMAGHTAPGGSLAPGSWLGPRSSAAGSKGSSSTRAAASSHLRPPAAATGGAAGAAADAAAAVNQQLLLLSRMYRSLAGLCCRALRLDLLLLAAHQLSALATVSHMCEEEDVMEVHPAIGSLTRLSARAAEELGPFLGRSKAAYAFSPLAGAAARYLMWVLADIPEMNALGVERMLHGLALLQGPLGALGAAAGAATAASSSSAAAAAAAGGSSSAAAGLQPSAAAAAAAGHLPAAAAAAATSAAPLSEGLLRVLERVKGYYTLAGLPASEVVRLAADKPGRYSVAEWEALLQVRVPGRPCGPSDMAALHRALDKHYTLSAGQKVAEFFDDVRQTVQAPVSSFTGGVSAGLKGGLSQAKALMSKAAGAVSDAASATATSVSSAAAKARQQHGGGGSGGVLQRTGSGAGGSGSAAAAVAGNTGGSSKA